MEHKICKNCNNNFTIAPDDFSFYERIAVPPPMWCPECRMRRRLAFRNERALHRRKSDATGKDIISIFRPDLPMKVYEHEAFYTDTWDPLEYGQAYDFSKPFFQQFKELMFRTPTIALFDSKSTNSSYCNVTVEHKNSYLCSAGWGNEDCMYMNRVAYNKNSMDLYICGRNEFCYENVYCENSNKLFYSHTSKSCNDSYFLYDCRSCSNCFGCWNLRNKSYCIFNEQYTREAYLEKMKEFDMSDYRVVQDIKKRVAELCKKAIHRYAQIYQSTNAVGDHIRNVRNAYYCFDFLDGAENVKYCQWSAGEFKDSYDVGPGSGGNSELVYDSVSTGVQDARCKFCFIVWYSHDIQYGMNCQSSGNLFGCVSVRSKNYCILNKQYTKEEYEELVPKIIQHMKDMPYVDQKGREFRYGEFFPPELSPFPYNDTIGQDYMPLSQEGAEAQGYSWGSEQVRNYTITKHAAELPEKIADVPDSITTEVIECAHKGGCFDQCATAFRIIPNELIFYKQLRIPLPRLCFNCRHWDRLRQRNPLKLWHRKCANCDNEFETTYAPDRPEIVYCEKCYNAEIL